MVLRWETWATFQSIRDDCQSEPLEFVLERPTPRRITQLHSSGSNASSKWNIVMISVPSLSFHSTIGQLKFSFVNEVSTEARRPTIRAFLDCTNSKIA